MRIARINQWFVSRKALQPAVNPAPADVFFQLRQKTLRYVSQLRGFLLSIACTHATPFAGADLILAQFDHSSDSD